MNQKKKKISKKKQLDFILKLLEKNKIFVKISQIRRAVKVKFIADSKDILDFLGNLECSNELDTLYELFDDFEYNYTYDYSVNARYYIYDTTDTTGT